MRIPPHLQDIKARLALQSFVDGRHFPRKAHFETIDLFKQRLEGPHHADEPNDAPVNPKLAVVIAQALDSEGYLLTHVIEQDTMPIDDEETWGKICLAAGWVVLQRYERECNNGDWPE
jgi:hypothetical protein